MKVTVKLFASFREATGQPQSVQEVTPGATLGELWGTLVEAHPRLAPLSGTASMALNGRYTSPDTTLQDGDVAAFLPPVSGG